MKWNDWTEKKLSDIFLHLKKRRVDLFIEKLDLGPNDQILDLGSEDGSYLSKFYPYPQNITIADINEEPMRKGVEKFGLKGYRVITPEGPLPINDGEFDAVWCNSVIEHVTIDRSKLQNVSNSEFDDAANAHQLFFAREISRIATKYLVQTPNIHFPIESHSWLPFISYIPHRLRYWIGQNTKKLWIKQWTADFHLYNRNRLKEHFPDSTDLIVERFAGIAKSFIIIKN